MMTESKSFKGIEYVQVCDLPVAQREEVMKTVNRDLFIKIMIDGKIISECLQYKDYTFWYQKVYKPNVIAGTESSQTISSGDSFKPELVLNT